MKEGDKYLKQIRLKRLMEFASIIITCIPYEPDWLYWVEWVGANIN